MVSWIDILTGLVVGFISGWLANYYFYLKQRKQNEINSKSIRELRQYVGAEVRAGNSSGKIVELRDGSFVVEVQRSVSETVQAKDSFEGKVIKRQD